MRRWRVFFLDPHGVERWTDVTEVDAERAEAKAVELIWRMAQVIVQVVKVVGS